MTVEQKRRTLANILRLRELERETDNPLAVEVREDLEADLGGTVTRNHAAELLGVSHTAFNKRVRSGDVPVVITVAGRREVPIPALLELREAVSRERAAGRRLHALEPVLSEARKRARRLRVDPELRAEVAGADRHRLSELRSLAYHRALAPRLRRATVAEAGRRLDRWQTDGRIDGRHADAWRQLFARPLPEIRATIGADDERGHDLRQSSPLAGLLSEPERRRILELVA